MEQLAQKIRAHLSGTVVPFVAVKAICLRTGVVGIAVVGRSLLEEKPGPYGMMLRVTDEGGVEPVVELGFSKSGGRLNKAWAKSALRAVVAVRGPVYEF